MKTNRIHTIRAAKPIKPRGKIVTKHRVFGNAYSPENPNVPLITEGGVIYKKANKALSRLSLNEAMQVKELMSQYKVMKKPLTLSHARWVINDPGTKISIFLHNMGISYYDILEQLEMQGYKLTVDYITNPSNWAFNKYEQGDATVALPDGRTAYFVFQYHGGFAVEVEGQLA